MRDEPWNYEKARLRYQRDKSIKPKIAKKSSAQIAQNPRKNTTQDNLKSPYISLARA